MKRQQQQKIFALVIFFLLLLLQVASSYKNIYGNKLQSCSQDGMALTGNTRTGYCMDRHNYNGSHHICIDLSSLASDNDDSNNQEFCDLTEQNDWCSSLMPCNEDQDEHCQVQNWCVCQDTFASYLQNAGGCDQIQDIVCDSINILAVRAYAAYAEKGSEKYSNAFDCITSRCDVSSNIIASYDTSNNERNRTYYWIGAFLVLSGAVTGYSFYRRRQHLKFQSMKESLMYGSDQNNENRVLT
mmetsp:Transcript_29524/g.33708  ORF Transcript_29524/g.33708 Transcript_29524/m.33708 type:complete len:242 (+) Transcript_29524:166-891(+)